MILQRDRVNIYGFGLINRFTAYFDRARDYTLQFTVSAVTSSLPLLSSSFQWRTFLFLCVSGRSPASATGFQKQQLTTTEPQEFSNHLTDSSKTSKNQSQSYGWRFTANQFGLAPSSLRLTSRVSFLQLYRCGHSSYVTYLWREGEFFLMNMLALYEVYIFTYSIGLHGYGECLSFQRSGQSDKSDNFDWRTSHEARDVSLRAGPHLYVSLAAVYWTHRADPKCHLH
jgi:hypothetical protein